MAIKIISGDFGNAAIIEPMAGGICYSVGSTFWHLLWPTHWQFVEIAKLELVALQTSGGEFYSTPGVSVTGYAAWGLEGLCLAEDERHQRPFNHTVVFDCILLDGRHFRAETSLQEWKTWQEQAAKPFAPPSPSETKPRALSPVTKVALYILLWFLVIASAGILGETLTNALRIK